MEVKVVKVKVLGKGSYGVVHLVKTVAPVYNKIYAVKSANESKSSSLRMEEEILQQFTDSPNIVQCFGGFTSLQQDEKVYNLFLEYASGGSLLDLMRKYGGKIPERDVKCYAKMILKGLLDIHGKGFIHSDLKPGNILVFPPEDGIGLDTLKIADFGLAKQCGVKDTLVRKNGFRGTALYMSPESVLGEVTAALDIWSFGCTVVQMITGKLPWGICDRKDLRDKLLRGESPNIPENMSIVGKLFLKKCFARDPNQRWSASMLLSHPYLLPHDTLFGLPGGFQQFYNHPCSSTNFQAKKVASPGFSMYNVSTPETRKFFEELSMRFLLRRKIWARQDEEERRRHKELCVWCK